MDENQPTFNVGVIKARDCLAQGWRLIREDYWFFLGIAVVGLLVSSALAIVLVGPMTCGIFLCLLRRHRGQKVSFDMLFEGFQYFLESFIATLVMMVPVLVIVGLFYVLVCGGFLGVRFAMMPQPGQQPAPLDKTVVVIIVAMAVVVLLLLFLAVVVVQSLFVFSYFLVVDRKMSGWEAVKLSVRAGWANLGGVIRLTLLNMLLSIAGLLVCYIGAFFVLPISYAMITAAYLEVFNEEAPEEEYLPPETGITPA